MKENILYYLNRLLLVVIPFFFFFSVYSSPPIKNGAGLTVQKTTERKYLNPDLEIVRKRIVEDLLEPPVKVEKVKLLVETLRREGSWPGIDYKDTSRTGFQHSIHLENMLDLARAYKKAGTRYYKNPAVKKTVSAALDFWIAHDFICENWWWNEMGTPNWMINTLLILDTDLTDQQRTEGARIASRASLTGVGARAGGDFVPIAGMICKQGLFKRDESILKNAIKVMSDQIVITDRRGINPDMGFHHRLDNVTSIHTYGTNYVSSFAYWAVRFTGTEFALPASALRLLIDYYLDGICKAMAYGIYADPGAENRDLSRKDALHAANMEIPQNLALVSEYRKAELENIIQVRKGLKSPDLRWNRYFWHSSYFAHQRKNYFASVRMYSSRQNNMEEPYNEEGLKMHHLADGSNFISRTGREYDNIFPVWDWQKIPGATIVQKPALPPPNQIAKKGLTDFVGGVTNGTFGVAAFDFKSVHDPLVAHKACFFFDREYICLGAGIQSESTYPVVTTLNQCLLKSEVIAKSKKGVEALRKGQHNLKEVAWILQDSVAYLFPEPVSVHLNNRMATGNWQQITHQAWAMKEPEQKKDVFTLWIDHGLKPQNASYEYIVVPGINKASMDNYVRTLKIAILSNTKDIQAVKHQGLNLTEIVFYKAGSFKLPEGLIFNVESPCIMMVKINEKSIQQITVSDPTQKLESLRFSLNTRIEASGDQWQSAWEKEKKMSMFQIDLPKKGYAGQSVVLEL